MLGDKAPLPPQINNFNLPTNLEPSLHLTTPVPLHPPHTLIHTQAAPKKKKKAAAAPLPPDKAAALELVKGLYMRWQAPVETLGRAGRAFDGLEALLGGAGFELEGSIWKRQVRAGS
jgi:hypothetical protein